MKDQFKEIYDSGDRVWYTINHQSKERELAIEALNLRLRVGYLEKELEESKHKIDNLKNAIADAMVKIQKLEYDAAFYAGWGDAGW